MSRMQHPKRAAIGLVVVCLSGLGATTGATLAHSSPASPRIPTLKAAPAVPGSDLGAIEANATAAGLTIPILSHAGEDVEISAPYSMSSLGSGGVGQGLTSILWPGSTGAHGGDALGLLGLKAIPTSVAKLVNDPEIANAQTGVGAASVDMSKPGLTMKSSATATHVSGTTSAGGAGIPLIGPVLGTTDAITNITITGARTVTTNATASIHNLSIAGVIKIKAVTTKLHAVSNGRTSHGTANTTVAGATIGGVPVTIDQKGIHLLTKKGLPIPLLGGVVDNVVNKTLKKTGIVITMTPVKHHVHKAHVTLSGSALKISLNKGSYKNNTNDTGNLLTLGAASIDLRASPGYPQGTITPVKTPPTPPTTPSNPGVSTGGGTSSGGVVPPVDNPPTGPTVSNPPPSSGLQPVLAADPVSLPKGLGLVWVILAIAGAGIFAFGMKRLPDEVLAATGDTCRLEED